LSREVRDLFSLSGPRLPAGTYSKALSLSRKLETYDSAKHGNSADANLVWQEDLSVEGGIKPGRFSARLFISNGHSVGLALDFYGLVIDKREVVDSSVLQNFARLIEHLPERDTKPFIGRYFLRPGASILIKESLLTSQLSVSMHRVVARGNIGPVELKLRRASEMRSDDARLVVEEQRWENHLLKGREKIVRRLIAKTVTGSDSSSSPLLSGRILKHRGVISFMNRSSFPVVVDFDGKVG
jgi:hypothetical protein